MPLFSTPPDPPDGRPWMHRFTPVGAPATPILASPRGHSTNLRHTTQSLFLPRSPAAPSRHVRQQRYRRIKTLSGRLAVLLTALARRHGALHSSILNLVRVPSQPFASSEQALVGSLDVGLQILLRYTTQQIAQRRSHEQALFLLTMLDVWLVQPLSEWAALDNRQSAGEESDDADDDDGSVDGDDDDDVAIGSVFANDKGSEDATTNDDDNDDDDDDDLFLSPVGSPSAFRHLYTPACPSIKGISTCSSSSTTATTTTATKSLPSASRTVRIVASAAATGVSHHPRNPIESAIDARLSALLHQALDFVAREYRLLDDDVLRHAADRINKTIAARFRTSDRRIPIQLDTEGILSVKSALLSALHSLALPPLLHLFHFPLRTHLPSLVLSFTHLLHQQVTVFRDFQTLLLTTPSPTSALHQLQQRNLIHPAILITTHPLHESPHDNTRTSTRESDFLEHSLRRLERILYPSSPFLHTALSLFLSAPLPPSCDFAQPFVDALFLSPSAIRLSALLIDSTSPTHIRSALVAFIRDTHPSVYATVAARDDLGSASGDSFARALLTHLLRSLASSSLDSSARSSFVRSLFSAPLRWLVHYNRLIEDAATQLYALLMQPVFLRSVLFRLIDWALEHLERHDSASTTNFGCSESRCSDGESDTATGDIFALISSSFAAEVATNIAGLFSSATATSTTTTATTTTTTTSTTTNSTSSTAATSPSSVLTALLYYAPGASGVLGEAVLQSLRTAAGVYRDGQRIGDLVWHGVQRIGDTLTARIELAHCLDAILLDSPHAWLASPQPLLSHDTRPAPASLEALLALLRWRDRVRLGALIGAHTTRMPFLWSMCHRRIAHFLRLHQST